jgi:hypothetical protein
VHLRYKNEYVDNGKHVMIDEGVRERVFSELRLLYRDINFKYDTLGSYLRTIDSYRSQFEGGENDFDIIYNKCKKTYDYLYQEHAVNVLSINNVLYSTVEIRG